MAREAGIYLLEMNANIYDKYLLCGKFIVRLIYHR